jgi:hypothetical protein
VLLKAKIVVVYILTRIICTHPLLYLNHIYAHTHSLHPSSLSHSYVRVPLTEAAPRDKWPNDFIVSQHIIVYRLRTHMLIQWIHLLSKPSLIIICFKKTQFKWSYVLLMSSFSATHSSWPRVLVFIRWTTCYQGIIKNQLSWYKIWVIV